MKSRKKTVISAIIVVLCFIVALVFLLIRIRGDNEKALDEKLRRPAVLFHGVFNTAKDLKADGTSGHDICVFFSNENLDYDEKNLTFANEKKGTFEGFNYYYINRPYSSQYDEESGTKTTMYLCWYDGKGSLILLDGSNGEAGRITVTAGKADFFGKRPLSYTWIRDGKKTPVYKKGAAPYSQGTSYLQSRYYSGKFPQ
ncbi:MAG: hypothetical protein ACLRJC_00835 [Emergencia timonensis]